MCFAIIILHLIEDIMLYIAEKDVLFQNEFHSFRHCSVDSVVFILSFEGNAPKGAMCSLVNNLITTIHFNYQWYLCFKIPFIDHFGYRNKNYIYDIKFTSHKYLKICLKSYMIKGTELPKLFQIPSSRFFLILRRGTLYISFQ